MARPADTSADAHRRQIMALGTMSPAERPRAFVELLADAIRRLDRAGVPYSA